MPDLELRLIPFTEPPAAAAANFLLPAGGGGVPDLRDVLVIVPTRTAGRRLVDALVLEAADRGLPGVFPPRVLTPNGVADMVVPPGARVAAGFEALVGWVGVLVGAGAGEFERVLPRERPDGIAWALALARELEGVRSELGEHGLTMGDVAGRASADAARWRELARLEERYLERLRAAGLEDCHHARAAGLASGGLPDAGETARVVVAFVPDPLPIALQVVERLAGQLPVAVLAHGTDAERGRIDRWGRPEASWADAEVAIPDFGRRVHLERDAAGQARRVVRLLGADGSAAVGVADAELVEEIAAHIGDAGWEAFDPAGVPAGEHALASLVRALARFVIGGGRFDDLCVLARCPAFLEAAAGADAQRCAVTLSALDEVRRRHLPGVHADLQRCLGLKRWQDGEHAGLQGVGRLGSRVLKNFRDEGFGEALRRTMGDIFGSKRFDCSQPDEAEAARLLRVLCEHASQVGAAIAGLGGADTLALGFELLGEELDAERLDGSASPEMVELHGWLELQWEARPHLVVAGFNEGAVPQRASAGAFLPERLRTELGIKDRRARLARDAYLLHALVEARREQGRLDIVLAKTGPAGDPLHPSRLLFRCADAELPSRAAHLFAELPAKGTSAASWTVPWKIVPPARPVDSLSVTAFKAYLQCPLRFYLSRVMRMRPVDPGAGELDAAEFGSLVHRALCKFGSDPEARALEDPAEIEAFLSDAVEHEARWRFGNSRSAALALQLETARRRLGWVAREQARLRADGWEIVEAELDVRSRLPGWSVAGLDLHGHIDRIDRRGAEVRVIDYKTFDKPAEPAPQHVKDVWFARGELRPYRVDPGGGRFWVDLQLPLYCIAAREIVGGCRALSAGYFCIGNTQANVVTRSWELPDADLDWAWACAEGVARDVRDKRFWPPADKVGYDDFEELLFGRPTETALPPAGSCAADLAAADPAAGGARG